MNVKIPYAMKQYGWNVIYTLPSDSDVWEFVPTKTNEILHANQALNNSLEIDKTDLKKINNRFWHFKGSRSKTAAIMTTADLLVHDEKDRSNLNVIGQYRSRIQRSTFKGVWELSNPSVKNSGIDVTWQQSDQKEWIIKCPYCKLDQMLDWTKNVDYQRKCYICQQCGKEISSNTIRLGKWFSLNPDSDISGYHISQMMAPWVSAKDLIREEANSDEAYFFNFILGEPIGGEGAYNFRQYIVDAWTARTLRDKGPHFMGVDVGSTKHFVIGNAEGIHTIGHVRTRIELENLIEYWNPTVVMDAGPERTWAEEFRRKYPKLWICFYKPDKEKKKIVRWGQEKEGGIVYVDRNRMIDKTLNQIIYGDLLFDLQSGDLDAYIRHWEVMTKMKEVNKLGQLVYRWVKTPEHAADHYAHATVYYNVARSRGGAIDYVSSVEQKRKRTLTIAGKDGEQMMDLKTYMEDRHK